MRVTMSWIESTWWSISSASNYDSSSHWTRCAHSLSIIMSLASTPCFELIGYTNLYYRRPLMPTHAGSMDSVRGKQAESSGQYFVKILYTPQLSLLYDCFQ